jgi:hypothetical protein
LNEEEAKEENKEKCPGPLKNPHRYKKGPIPVILLSEDRSNGDDALTERKQMGCSENNAGKEDMTGKLQESMFNGDGLKLYRGTGARPGATWRSRSISQYAGTIFVSAIGFDARNLLYLPAENIRSNNKISRSNYRGPPNRAVVRSWSPFRGDCLFQKLSRATRCLGKFGAPTE